MLSRYPEDWTLQAKCRGMEDALFPEGANQKRARQICMDCPVRNECLVEALDNRIEWGVWGGMTERERRQLLRQRTDIVSWSEVILGDRQGKSLGTVDRKALPVVQQMAVLKES